jgi:predicted metal-dependent hydrolase
MKRSSRPPSRSAKRDAYGGLPEQPADSIKYVPLSLKTGAGRQHWDEVLGLLVKIRAECDAAAERLGYTSPKDDGLSAVEYIATNILEAVRSERQQQIVNAKKEAPTRPHQSSKQSLADYETGYKTEKPLRRFGHSERTKSIDELKQILRNRKTKLGELIDSQLAHEMAKQITILSEGLTRPETPESIKQMRESIAPFLAKLYDRRKKKSKAPTRSVVKKPQRAKGAPPRARRTATRGTKGRSR